MSKIKKLVALIAIAATTSLSLVGCSNEGKALYGALNKTQSIKSAETSTEMNLKFSAKGLTEENEEAVAKLIPFIDNSKITMTTKMGDNDGKTKAKVQSDMTFEFGDTATKMAFWMDYNLNGDKPVIKEVFKFPAIVTSAMGPEFRGKEYAVMDFSDTKNVPEMEGVDYKDMMKFSKDFEKKTTEFLSKYLEQYNPSGKMITNIGTKTIENESLQMYQIKLDDAAFKDMLKYSSNNLLENKDAVKFMKEYLSAVSELTTAKGADKDKLKAEFEKSIKEFDENLPEAQKQFNEVLDTIKDTKIIGEKGIVLNYGVNKDGYVVNQSGTMDFTINVEKLGKAFDKENGGKEKGIYNLTLNFNSNVKNINKPIEIKMPELTSKNSFNYFDLVKDSMETPIKKQVQINK